MSLTIFVCRLINNFLTCVKSIFYTCDTLMAVEDTLEPMSRLSSTDIRGTAAETVPNKGKPGILRIPAVDDVHIPLFSSFKYRLCSKNLPKYQPPKLALVNAVKLNTIRLVHMFPSHFLTYVKSMSTRSEKVRIEIRSD